MGVDTSSRVSLSCEGRNRGLQLRLSSLCLPHIPNECQLVFILDVRFILLVVPEFSKRPVDRVVAEGQNVTFPCEANGVPVPVIKWNFSGGALARHRLEEGTLTLYKVENTAEFEGNYTCIASSSAGTTATNITLIVDSEFVFSSLLQSTLSLLVVVCINLINIYLFIASPRLLSPLEDVAIQVGGRLVLICNVSADPIARISWTKNNLTLPPHYKLEAGNSTLVIESVSFEDDGEYRCVATNRQGNVSSRATVEVQGTWSASRDCC